MKIQVLAAVLLIIGMLIGGTIAAVITSNDNASLNQQVIVLKDQNSNLEHQVQTLQNQSTSMNRTVTNLTGQVDNLTGSLQSANQALLTPTLSLNFTKTANDAFTVSITSISNVGVHANLVSTNVTPSKGVTVSPWLTHDHGLMSGDSVTISGLIMGELYHVKMIYKPTQGEMAQYDTTFPAPVGEFDVVKIGAGVYNITLASISTSSINTSQISMVHSSPNLPGASWTGSLVPMPPYHTLAAGDYLLGTNLTEPGFNYTIDLIYNPSGVTIASTTISIPAA